VYVAYGRAAEDALRDVAEPVPLHLRNAPTRLMKELDYAKGYRYAHDEREGVADMSCLPPSLEGRRYYNRPNEGSRRRSSAASTGGRDQAPPARGTLAPEARVRDQRLGERRHLAEHFGTQRQEEREPVVACMRPTGMATSSPSWFSTPPPDTPGCPSVRHVTRP